MQTWTLFKPNTRHCAHPWKKRIDDNDLGHLQFLVILRRLLRMSDINLLFHCSKIIGKIWYNVITIIPCCAYSKSSIHNEQTSQPQVVYSHLPDAIMGLVVCA